MDLVKRKREKKKGESFFCGQKMKSDTWREHSRHGLGFVCVQKKHPPPPSNKKKLNADDRWVKKPPVKFQKTFSAHNSATSVVACYLDATVGVKGR